MSTDFSGAEFNCKLCSATHPIRDSVSGTYHPCFVPAMLDTIGFMLLGLEERLSHLEKGLGLAKRYAVMEG